MWVKGVSVESSLCAKSAVFLSLQTVLFLLLHTRKQLSFPVSSLLLELDEKAQCL